MAKKFRWVCPTCNAGRLLGARPKKQATARYCLPCSEKSGLLVGLVCPKLLKKSTASCAVRKEKRAILRERKKLKFMIGDLDIVKEMNRVWKIAVKLEPRLSGKRNPTLEVKHWKTAGGHLLGFVRCQEHLVRINLFADSSTAKGVQRVIVHEIAHLVAYKRRVIGEPMPHHGDIWRAAHAELSQDSLGRTPHAEVHCEGY